MRQTLQGYAGKIAHEKKTRTGFLAVLIAIAIVASGGIFWQFYYTGVAAANETYCGTEEHTHTDECYEQTLVCDLVDGEFDPVASAVHTHTDACYEAVLICTMSEHVHTDECVVSEDAQGISDADPDADNKEYEAIDDNGKVNTAVSVPGGALSYNADLAATGSSDFIFQYTWTGGGYTGFGVNLKDDAGNGIAGTQTGGNATVDMPYTIDVELFANNSVSPTGSYDFLYATVTDPNYGDTEHDLYPEYTNVGVRETYGSPENPITGITISGTNADPSLDQVSKTWHYELTFADETSVTVLIYGNQNGGIDNNGRGLYCPKFLELNLYYEPAETYAGTYDGVIFNTANKTANKLASNGAGRTAVSGLSEYADSNGDLEIILPTDSDLGKKFVVYQGENGITYESPTELGNFTNYDWKLVGWYNIANGEYYPVEDGVQTTAVVDLHNDNVFYSNYIAADYDFGYSTDADRITTTVSTADFVTMHLFDYNELFNLYNTDLVTTHSDDAAANFTNSAFDETWSDSGDFCESPTYLGSDRSDRSANSFILLGNANGSGTLLNPSNYKTWNSSTTNVHSASNWNITDPVLDKEKNPILWSLFSADSDKLGVNYVGTADNLFQYGVEGTTGSDGQDYNGYYYYSSNLNSVAYNQTDESFYLYDYNEYYGGNTLFLPFNHFTDGVNHSDSQINYWFGMNMEVEFYLPDATGTVANPSENMVNGEEMVFNFSGDDDIIIFVDDQLVLDMAGIHTEAVGNINYAEGTWSYYLYDYNHNRVNDKSGTFDLTSGDHMMTVYYLERGRSASNLTISFNIIPQWRYESDFVTTVTAEKDWADGADAHISDTVRLGLFEQTDTYVFDEQNNSFTVGDKVYVYKENESYTLNGRSYNYDAFYFENEGSGIAWYDTEQETLYVLAGVPLGDNPVDLSVENGWSYTWDLLDKTKNYRVLEMTLIDGYLSTYAAEQDPETEYAYWSIIGETELEDTVAGKDGTEITSTTIQVVLTDAAQSATAESGNKGAVINHDLSAATDIIFSMIPTTEMIESDINNVDGWNILTVYGVVSDTQITESQLWTLTYTTDTADEIYGSTTIHTFTLSYIRDESTYYLAVEDAGTGFYITADPAQITEFYCDSAGEFRIYTGDHSDQRVAIDANGNLVLENTSDLLKFNNLHIYTLTAGHTALFDYDIVNTPGRELPNTGGAGTLAFTLIGLLFVGGAVTFLIYRQRKEGKSKGVMP